MSATTAVAEPRQFTAKGYATRARILECAADLIYAEGVHATNNEKIRRAAGVSGSQINHYFPTKESLVLAVIQWQSERVLGFQHSEDFHAFEDFQDFRAWATYYTDHDHGYGCSLGSLASEIVKTDLDVHGELAAAFAQWRQIFTDALTGLQARGRLRAEANPERLATLLLAAFQGGMLLAQVAQEVTPLRDALDGALDAIDAFAVPQRAEGA
jgi:AcrR family transcriptional regulator